MDARGLLLTFFFKLAHSTALHLKLGQIGRFCSTERGTEHMSTVETASVGQSGDGHLPLHWRS